MADTFSKPSNGEQKLNWAKIWFKKFMKFHNIEFAKGQQWDFSTDQVIAYLRSRRDEKTPAWNSRTGMQIKKTQAKTCPDGSGSSMLFQH